MTTPSPRGSSGRWTLLGVLLVALVTTGPTTFVATVPDVLTADQRDHVTVVLALLANDRMHWPTRVSP